MGVGQPRGRSRTPKPAPRIPPRDVPPRLLHPTPQLAGLRGAGFQKDRTYPPSSGSSPAKKPLEGCDSREAALFRESSPLPASRLLRPALAATARSPRPALRAPPSHLSLFVALHSNLRRIGRAPGNRMYLAEARGLMSAKCRKLSQELLTGSLTSKSEARAVGPLCLPSSRQ